MHCLSLVAILLVYSKIVCASYDDDDDNDDLVILTTANKLKEKIRAELDESLRDVCTAPYLVLFSFLL